MAQAGFRIVRSVLCEQPKFALEMIKRSRNLPITIVASFRKTLAHGPLHHLLQGRVFVDNLRLSIQSVELVSLHECIQNVSANIKHLQLKRQYLEDSDSDWEDSDEEEVDDGRAIEAILEIMAPSLLSLELESFSMPPTTIDFPRLTKLALNGGLSRLTSNEILVIIRRAPLLEYINLGEVVLRPEKLAPENSTAEARLPCLRDFIMTNEGAPGSMACVLQYICFPSDTRISLTLLSCSQDEIATFLDAVAFACLSLQEDTIQYLSVTGAEDQLLISGWTLPPGSAPHQSLRINCEIWNPNISLAHQTAIARLPLSGVHSLWIAGEPCVGMTAYLALPRLQRVGLQGACAWKTGEPLERVYERGADVISKLDVLALRAVNFNGRTPTELLAGKPPPLTQSEIALPSSLVSFIRRTRERGAPLSTLVLDDCKEIPEGLGNRFTEKEQAMIKIDRQWNYIDKGGFLTYYRKRTTLEAYYWLHIMKEWKES